MKENIKTLLQNKEIELTNWERKFLEDIYDKTERNRSLTYKQVSVVNKLLAKNNLLPEKIEGTFGITDNAVIRKLEDILVLTESHKDGRFQFFTKLYEFYNKKGYLSQKQKNVILNFDKNYSGKTWTARPKGGR